MTQDLEFGSDSGVLTPSVPWDAGVRAQQQRIFDAMAKSGAEKTFSATTIADIVGYASISRATFYKHFSDKQACFHATVAAFLEELEEVAGDAYAASMGPHPDAVREVVAALLHRLAAKPDHAKLLLLEASVIDPDTVKRCRELALDALNRLPLYLETGPNAGTPDPETAFGSAMVLIAGHLGAGQGGELATLLPELVYITLRPYTGEEIALAQARLAQ